MARTVLLGKAEQKKIDAMKATIEALEAGIAQPLNLEILQTM